MSFDFNKIVFLGAGRMAAAIAGGLINKGLNSEKVVGFDISQAALERFADTTGAEVETDLESVLADADIVVIAVKPQNISGALGAAAHLLKEQLLISIAAGVKISRIIELTDSRKIVRVMPNTPALVGEGASAFAVADGVSDDDIRVTESILGAVGICKQVAEKQLDAVTGLSGSGPAYVFSFIQALADGGVRAGLPRDTALQLAAQTVFGAAKMVLETGEHPAVLSDQVTSPGGTTAAGLAELENRAFKGITSSAVIAASERSAELGKS